MKMNMSLTEEIFSGFDNAADDFMYDVQVVLPEQMLDNRAKVRRYVHLR